MEDFIKSIVVKIVDNPGDVEVSEVQGEKTTIYELKVNPDDLGRIIGKRGKTINAIRSVLKAASAKNENKVLLEVLD
jgi:predicted RNA-binding protein YlqC (UPF0109 family)